MKILLASFFSLPSIGGLWTYVQQLKQYLERMGHEVHVFAHHPEKRSYYMLHQSEDFDIAKIEAQISPVLSPAYYRVNAPSDPAIAKMERQRYIYEMAATHFGIDQYDLIHTQDIISTMAIARIKAKKTPLIATIHGCYTTESLANGIIQEKGSTHWQYSSLLEYYGATSSDLTIIPSQWMKNVLTHQFNVPHDYMRVIPNGMDIDLFLQGIRNESEIILPDDKKVIACIARLHKLKGHYYLLEALAKLKNERTDWICWIIGSGDLQEELERQAKGLHLEEHVLFLGARNDIAALLTQVDICVLPSLQENCPYSVMEAQVAGKPLVASTAGGIPEMVEHEKTGLLSPPAQSEPLYLNIKKILEEETLRKEIAKNAEIWGKSQWSLDVMMERMLAVYEQALQKNR
jgi:glycosyltransferase involved in cell wall biosynthesis